ncbi:uncharacterized protein LOC135842718 [Planococcus citri]|uniref:uncharacterized protein LOC135842718 n=1 Tax=Planococcus citri TaxID=170843 RepID=UPI0031F82F27
MNQLLSTTVLLFSFKLSEVTMMFPNAYDVLVELPFFVDKTEMLKTLFDDEQPSQAGNPFYYITCPRGFGKTINLLMVKSFAEIILDENGHPKNYTETETFARFSKLNIAKHDNIMSNHMARYPVIIIDLSDIFHYGTSLEDTCLALNTILWFELQNYIKLHELDKHLEKFEKPDRQFIQNIQRKNFTAEQVQMGLYRLTKILYELFNETKVIILVDEFDTTATLSLLTTKTYALEANAMINGMLTQAFEYARKYIKLVLLTGITTLSYSSDPNKLHNTPHFPFLNDHQFTAFYGFGEQDVDKLFDKYECDETERIQVRERHKGYSSSQNGTILYNSFSMVNYFMNKENDTKVASEAVVKNAFKQRTPLGPMSNFLKNSEFRKHIEDLLEKGKFTYPISKIHHPDAINTLMMLKGRRFAGTEPIHVPTFFTFYFEMGYFSHFGGNHTYVLPNQEVTETLDAIMKVYKELSAQTTPSRV